MDGLPGRQAAVVADQRVAFGAEGAGGDGKRTGGEVVFGGEGRAIDPELTVEEFDAFTGQADDAFGDVLVPIAGDDDVAAARGAAEIGASIHQEQFAAREGGQHAGTHGEDEGIVPPPYQHQGEEQHDAGEAAGPAGCPTRGQGTEATDRRAHGGRGRWGGRRGLRHRGGRRGETGPGVSAQGQQDKTLGGEIEGDVGEVAEGVEQCLLAVDRAGQVPGAVGFLADEVRRGVVVKHVEVNVEPSVRELLPAQEGEERVGQGQFLARAAEFLEALFKSLDGLGEALAGGRIGLVAAAPGLEDVEALEVLSVQELAAEGAELGTGLFDFRERARDIEELERRDFLEGRGSDLWGQEPAGGEAEVAGGGGQEEVGQDGYDFHQ